MELVELLVLLAGLGIWLVGYIRYNGGHLIPSPGQLPNGPPHGRKWAVISAVGAVIAFSVPWFGQ